MTNLRNTPTAGALKSTYSTRRACRAAALKSFSDGEFSIAVTAEGRFWFQASVDTSAIDASATADADLVNASAFDASADAFDAALDNGATLTEATAIAAQAADDERASFTAAEAFAAAPILPPQAEPVGNRDLIDEAMIRGIAPDGLAGIAERAQNDREAIWTILQGFPVLNPEPAFEVAQDEPATVSPGLARLRRAPNADEMRASALADQEIARKAMNANPGIVHRIDFSASGKVTRSKVAAEKAAAQKAEKPVKAPKAAAAPKAEKPAKAEKAAKAPKAAKTEGTRQIGRAVPPAGTKGRVVFDLLRRPEGVTGKELCEAELNGVKIKASPAGYCTDFARTYGFEAHTEQDGKVTRFWLRELATSAVA